MENKKVYIFLGPPYSGKETQTTPLSRDLGIPVFSMGQLIREGREQDPAIEDAFQQYTVRGLHIPTKVKFELLRKKMDEAQNGFILDNFPATHEDLEVFRAYCEEKNLDVSKVFYLHIDEEEMLNRFAANPHRGRLDDAKETLLVRSKVQGVDREPVLQYFRENGKLVEINGQQPIEAVSELIHGQI